MKKALLIDLDNTIYPVSSIGPVVFGPVMDKIRDTGRFDRRQLDEIFSDMQRKPFQFLAQKFVFPETLTNECFAILMDTSIDIALRPFDDYAILRTAKAERYLVTSGFTKLQQSKISHLGIREDFAEIHIIDPLISTATKKEVFAGICRRKRYAFDDVLVIGDDPESEIRAAKELGIEYIFYDRIGMFPQLNDPNKIDHYQQVQQRLT